MSSKGRMYERTGEGLAKQRKKSAIPLVQSMYHTGYVSLKLCMIHIHTSLTNVLSLV